MEATDIGGKIDSPLQNRKERIKMLQGVKDLKAVLNEQGYYDIAVNGVVVCEMVSEQELAEAIEAVLKDEYGMVADMLEE